MGSFLLTAVVGVAISLLLIRPMAAATWYCEYPFTTILSSIRVDGATVPLVFSGALNRARFKEYLTVHLLPTLKPGDIVIADNLKAHKGDGISELIASVGATMVYLPPYSPDLNPIELMWSKIKAYLRML